MKKVMISMLVGLLGVSMAYAQTPNEKEEFAKWQEFQRIKSGKTTVTEDVSRFAGVGKEIGIALKDAVQALDQTMTVTEEHVYKFASTPAGKVTIGLIVWKVAGKALLGVIIGFILLFALVPWIYFWTRYFIVGRMILDKKVTKSWFFSEKIYVRAVASKDLSEGAYGFLMFVFAVGTVALFTGSMVCFFG